MTEVSIKIPEDIKDIIDGITEPLYVEALREVARKRFAYNQKTLKEFRKKIAIFEAKYDKSMRNFRRVYQILSKDTMIGLNGHTLLK